MKKIYYIFVYLTICLSIPCNASFSESDEISLTPKTYKAILSYDYNSAYIEFYVFNNGKWSEKYKAVLDTGCTCMLSAPLVKMKEWEMVSQSSGKAIIADGSLIDIDYSFAKISLFDREITGDISFMQKKNNDDFLIGMKAISALNVTMSFVPSVKKVVFVFTEEYRKDKRVKLFTEKISCSFRAAYAKTKEESRLQFIYDAVKSAWSKDYYTQSIEDFKDYNTKNKLNTIQDIESTWLKYRLVKNAYESKSFENHPYALRECAKQDLGNYLFVVEEIEEIKWIEEINKKNHSKNILRRFMRRMGLDPKEKSNKHWINRMSLAEIEKNIRIYTEFFKQKIESKEDSPCLSPRTRLDLAIADAYKKNKNKNSDFSKLKSPLDYN